MRLSANPLVLHFRRLWSWPWTKGFILQSRFLRAFMHETGDCVEEASGRASLSRLPSNSFSGRLSARKEALVLPALEWAVPPALHIGTPRLAPLPRDLNPAYEICEK